MPVRPPVLFLLAFALVAMAARAQEPGFTRYGPAQGLPTRSVMDLAQDRRGFVWIATEHGLARYDGARFRFFEAHPDSAGALAGAVVFALAPGPAGGVWAWTGGGGLQRFDPRMDRFVTVPTAPALVPGRTYVYTMMAGRGGALWFGTEEGVFTGTPGRPLRRVDGDGGAFSASSLSRGADGRVWMASDKGLFVADERGGPAARVPLPDGVGVPSAVLASRTGAVFVGTERGVYQRSAGGAVTRRLATASVLALAEDPAGEVWAGTENGLWRISNAGAPPAHFVRGPAPTGLPEARVNGLLVDAGGTLWATGGGVVARPTRPAAASVRPGPGGATAPDVLSVLPEADGGVWLGGVGGGVCRTVASACPPLPHALAYAYAPSLARAPDGTLWVAAYRDGLQCVPPGTSRVRPCGGPPPAMRYPRTVLFDRRGRLWVATGDRGLFVRESAQSGGGWTHLPFSLDATRSDSLYGFTVPLVEARDGSIYVGTLGAGLWRVRGAGGRWRAARVRLRADEPRVRLRVASLAEASDGALYVGTLGHGVARLEPARGGVRWFGVAEGLPSSIIHALAAGAAGSVWAFADGAASMIDAGGVRTLGADEGYPDAAPYWNAAARGPDGRMYVGTSAGAVVFDPARLAAPRAPPPPYFTEVRVHGHARVHDASFVREVRFGPDDDAVSIDLASSDPGPVRAWRYAYRLLRARADTAEWTSLGNRATLDLAGLAPGAYRLQARTEAPGALGPVRTLALRVAAPFHATWWFRALLLLLAGALLTAAYRLRVAHLLALERTRRRIADDLHDDLGAKMSTLAVQIELAGVQTPDAAGRATLRALADGTRALVGDLRDTVWVVDGEHDTLASFVERVETIVYRLLGPGRARVLRPDVLPDVPLPMGARRHLLLLVKEALHNAHRHAPGAGVTVAVTLGGGALVIEVRDDGAGFDLEATLHAGQGLASMRRRAHAAGARFDIETACGAGTAVRVTLPLGARGDGARWPSALRRPARGASRPGAGP